MIFVLFKYKDGIDSVFGIEIYGICCVKWKMFCCVMGMLMWSYLLKNWVFLK